MVTVAENLSWIVHTAACITVEGEVLNCLLIVTVDFQRRKSGLIAFDDDIRIPVNALMVQNKRVVDYPFGDFRGLEAFNGFGIIPVRVQLIGVNKE